MKKKSCLCLLVLLVSCAVVSLCACSPSDKPDRTPVSAFDLSRYTGTWYELARYDHSFERGLQGCMAHYSINQDGSIQVVNNGLKGDRIKVSKGRAKVTDTIGVLRVSFFLPFYSEYRVLMVSSDYRYALVGSSSEKYLWILSRTPELPAEEIEMVLDEASRRGYDIGDLIWVDQSSHIM